MPIYEYQAIDNGCPYCAKGFEILQRSDERSLRKCPRCHHPVVRTISPLGRIDVAYTPSDAFKHYCRKMEQKQRQQEKQGERADEE